MKALYYTATQQSEIRQTAEPVAGQGETIINVSHCGICGSDMHAWHGLDERRVPPLILGHEASGIAQSGRFEGKRVVVNPLMTCGECPACLSADEHLCANRELIGMRVPGAFAERVAIAEDNLLLLPDALSFEQAALTEPLACGVHAVNLAAGVQRLPLAASNVIVQGGGAIGLLLALVLKHRGVENLTIVEPNAGRRADVQKSADVQVADPGDRALAPSSADIIFDAVGAGVTRRDASVLVRPGGWIIHTGLQNAGEGLDTRRLTLQEIGFLGTYCYRKTDFSEALGLLAEGLCEGLGFFDVRPLDEGVRSFEDIHNGKAPPKILLEM